MLRPSTIYYSVVLLWIQSMTVACLLLCFLKTSTLFLKSDRFKNSKIKVDYLHFGFRNVGSVNSCKITNTAESDSPHAAKGLVKINEKKSYWRCFHLKTKISKSFGREKKFASFSVLPTVAAKFTNYWKFSNYWRGFPTAAAKLQTFEKFWISGGFFLLWILQLLDRRAEKQKGKKKGCNTVNFPSRSWTQKTLKICKFGGWGSFPPWWCNFVNKLIK